MSSFEATEPFDDLGAALPRLRFDAETAGALVTRLGRLEDRVAELKRRLLEQQPCEAVQAGVLELRDEVTGLAVQVLRAHMETCIARCVQAGESTAALGSLKTALGRLLQHL